MPYTPHDDWFDADEEGDSLCEMCGLGLEECCGQRNCSDCHPEEAAEEEARRRQRRRMAEGGDPRHNYSYKPTPDFRGGAGGTPGLAFYGMEIEITCSSTSTMRWVADQGNGLYYLKKDASVRGFELVTHPMTYAYAIDQFPWSIFPELRQQGCTVIPRTNGIHVHVSRSGFDTSSHALRWLKLLYRNQADVMRIARREGTDWARWTKDHQSTQFAHILQQKGLLIKRNERASEGMRVLDREWAAFRNELDSRYPHLLKPARTWTEEDAAAQMAYRDEYTARRTPYMRDRNRLSRLRLEDHTSERYSAVNTRNRETFEVRLFASTLDPVTAQSTIGMVAATVEYARQLRSPEVIKGEGLTWAKFTEWLNAQPLYSAVKFANANCTKPSPDGRATIG